MAGPSPLETEWCLSEVIFRIHPERRKIMHRRERARFSPEFKDEAVRLTDAGRLLVRACGRSSDVSLR
jgi:hypothetical protein